MMAKETKQDKNVPEEEEVEEEEQAEKAPQGRSKIKPKLDKETKKLLEKRKERLDDQPAFNRGEWFRYKKLGTSWRRPRGVTNKIRRNRGYRPPKVRIGYGKPAAVRNLHPSGFSEVLIHNVNDLEGIDPKVQAARIGSTVGTRKRRSIIEAADAKGIRILNRGAL
jgi:large subunit ribosomal protein L32e